MNTPLHQAAGSGDLEATRLLLSHGAAVNAIGRDGWPPLSLGARVGSVAVVEAILGAGADPLIALPSGKLAHEIAELNGRRDAAKLLAAAHAAAAARAGADVVDVEALAEALPACVFVADADTRAP